MIKTSQKSIIAARNAFWEALPAAFQEEFGAKLNRTAQRLEDGGPLTEAQRIFVLGYSKGYSKMLGQMTSRKHGVNYDQ